MKAPLLYLAITAVSNAWFPSLTPNQFSNTFRSHRNGFVTFSKSKSLIVSKLDNLFVVRDPSALTDFLGEIPIEFPTSYEDGRLENIAEHNRECLSQPWSNFRRTVPFAQRDLLVPNWSFPNAELGWDDEEAGGRPVALHYGPDVAVSQHALLTPAECDSIVAEAEAVDAWSASFSYAGTPEAAAMPQRIRLELLPQATALLGGILAVRIAPALEAAFPSRASVAAPRLRLHLATILRYDAAAGRVATPLHQDLSSLTALVALNEDFAGGGTYLAPLGSAVRTPRGSCIAHAGSVWHAGHPVTAGVRYALALFFHSTGSVAHASRFAQRADHLLAQGRLRPARDNLVFALRAAAAAAAAAQVAAAAVASRDTEARARCADPPAGRRFMTGVRDRLHWVLCALEQSDAAAAAAAAATATVSTAAIAAAATAAAAAAAAAATTSATVAAAAVTAAATAATGPPSHQQQQQSPPLMPRPQPLQ